MIARIAPNSFRCLLYLLPLALFAQIAAAEGTFFAATRQLALQGDAEAQFSLGLLYDTGQQVQRNPQLAASWFQKAADQGLAGACLYLGMKYEFGAGVEQDRAKALHWYRQAALQGWIQAAFLLGNLYLNLENPDPVQGCAWLQISAQQGYPGAEERNLLDCTDLDPETKLAVTALRSRLQKQIDQNTQAATGM